MAGSFDGSNDRYVSISDAPILSWQSSGWAFSAHIFPDSSITDNTFGYIYSHAQPLNFVAAFNIFRNGPGSGETVGTIRILLDNTANLLDVTTASLLVDDEWNHIMVTYDGVNVRAHINGVSETFSPPSLGTINPGVNARIGFAAHGGSREFAGRICNVAKWSTIVTSVEADRQTSSFVSPGMYRRDMDFHFELFDQQTFDDMNNVSGSAESMLWGNHAPIIFPRSPTSYLISQAVQNEMYANVRYG